MLFKLKDFFKSLNINLMWKLVSNIQQHTSGIIQLQSTLAAKYKQFLSERDFFAKRSEERRLPVAVRLVANFAAARDGKLDSVSRSGEKKGDVSRGCTGFASKVPLKRPPLFLRGIGHLRTDCETNFLWIQY